MATAEPDTVPQGPGSSTTLSQPRVKHDWYQTETLIVLNIMMKNMKQDDVRLMFGQQTLSVSLKLPEASELTLGFNLAHQIVPAQSSYKIMSTKIEVKMKKLEDIRWEKLEIEPKACEKPEAQKTQNKNWDKVVGDLTKSEDDKPEGEAALNALFQQIYGDGSDDVRRAMNKSFVESGGTVLSTVWKDVGKEKVDVKPPEGMEWRKWDQ